MSKKGKQALVPELRFPEFQEKEGWSMKSFSELFKIGSGRDYKHLEPGDIPVYGSGGYMLSVNDYLYDGKSACIGRKGTIDKPMFLSGKFWTVDTLFYTHGFVDCTPEFIFILFQQVDWLRYNEAGGIPSLSKAIIGGIEAPVPGLDEQHKIATCLSSLDALLAAERAKLEALKEHKQGLMQQLFPAEGEKLPKLRFPGFEGEWEHRPLGDIGDVQMCKRIFAEETNESEGVPFYKIGTLGGKPDAFISRELFEEYKSKYNYPRTGEVLITCSGTVGKCLVYDGSDAYYQDSNIVWIDNPKERVVNRMLYYLLERKDWKELSSTTITRIYGSDLRAVPLWFPKSKKEQELVAGCLEALDEMNTSQSEFIAALEYHKRGLMHGLFPSNG